MKKVVVIGGGPAGMMAAATAADNGAEVILLEKQHRLGRKLLITGKGRCNITNDLSIFYYSLHRVKLVVLRSKDCL